MLIADWRLPMLNVECRVPIEYGLPTVECDGQSNTVTAIGIRPPPIGSP